MRDGIGFFGTFLRNPTAVGAVLPSSRYLSRALVGDLSHLGEGELVVEYGPGTGPMTAVIRDRLPPGVRYLGIELQSSFCQLLAKRFPAEYSQYILRTPKFLPNLTLAIPRV